MSAKTQIFDHEGIAKGFPSRGQRQSVEKIACYARMIKNLSFGTKFSFISIKWKTILEPEGRIMLFHFGCGKYRYFLKEEEKKKKLIPGFEPTQIKVCVKKWSTVLY